MREITREVFAQKVIAHCCQLFEGAIRELSRQLLWDICLVYKFKELIDCQQSWITINREFLLIIKMIKSVAGIFYS